MSSNRVNPLAQMFADEVRAFNDVEYFVTCPRLMDINWLWPGQMDALKRFYNSEKNYQEMVFIAGMRSGKTTTASVIAAYEAFKLITLGKPLTHYGLPKGSKIFILIIATSERQALDTVFSQIKARIKNSPWFETQEYEERYNEFSFKVGDGEVIIRSEHSNSGSIAGKTSICVVFEELARFVDTGGRASAEMVYYTASRQIKTFGEAGKLVTITSPLYMDDFAMQLYKQAKRSSKMLGILKATWEVNPNITRESLDDDFMRNPEATWRDYGAVPSASLETYFKEPWLIEDAINNDRVNMVDTERGCLRENMYGDPQRWYYLAGDPAFKNDGFGFAMVHREKDKVIADIVFRMMPMKHQGDHREIDAMGVKQLVLDIASKFRLACFVVDTWQFPETVQALRAAGVKIVQNVVTKEEYDYLKELIYTKGIEIPRYDKLVEELKMLELTRGAKIDHPRDGSKDVADALANAAFAERKMIADFQPPVYVSVDM